MSKPFDYSKWDNIELSDDEDDVHPNIDRESWFRMKHRSRVEREEREEVDKKRIRKEMDAADFRIKEIEKILSGMDGGGDDDDSDDEDLEDRDGLEAELSELRRANAKRRDKLDDYEKNKKWNVDNMCKVVEERTIISTGKDSKFSKDTGFIVPDEDEEALKKKDEELSGSSSPVPEKKGAEIDTDKVEKDMAATAIGDSTKKTDKKGEEEAAQGPAQGRKRADASVNTVPKKEAGPERERISMLSYHEFTEKYADLVEEFMAMRDLEKCKAFLIQHGDVLLQENASNYLLLASLEDEMNGFHEKMRLTARQSQIVSNIAELAKSLKSHPGNVILPFFAKLDQKEFLEGFLEGVEAFIDKIEKRAVVKKKEIDEERAKAAKESGGNAEGAVDLADVPKEERLGPGGLDPVEVFESLPASMQEAFESRDTDKLKDALLALEPGQAEYFMKRCVDSGLWNEG
uniref:Hsp90 chaperone protein kinase-targeting subunit n=1 Tax=Pseudictyota dubia TaxID=2749911 RepID=A0A7R9ZDN1_9STRA